jgi:uncharacterized protein (TIGR02118 family)
MVRLMILFRQGTKSGTFDLRYARNLALLRKMPGVQAVRESQIVGGPAGQAPYHRLVEVSFASFDALDAALRSPEGVAAGKDLMDFAGSGAEVLFVEESPDLSAGPLGPANLQAFLDNHQIDAQIVFPGAPTPTVPAAARALGVEEDQIVKSVVFLVDDRPFLVYGCGTRRVDPRKLAERLNVSRKKVRLADADQVLEITGYAVGTVPPVGLKTPMPAFMDPAIQRYETVYAGGGGIDALLRIRSAELLRVSGAEIAPMLRDDEAEAESVDNADEP